ncbi:MAG: hypothetical protein SPF22_01095 [Candidatus Onthovivens sp.]|nr:hypothetical protein [Candidatus Onthovivens sp.]
MRYSLWNKADNINGVEASHFLNQSPFKNYSGDIILIFSDDNRVSNVECKEILAKIYDIDDTLPLDEFMTAYKEKITQKE